jgi:hypothetical protein
MEVHPRPHTHVSAPSADGFVKGVAQTTNQSFGFNGESDLDLEYAMSLTNPQPITLLQTGDLVEGNCQQLRCRC